MQMSLASTSSNENVAAKLILHQDCARSSMIRTVSGAVSQLLPQSSPARKFMHGCQQHQFQILGATCPRVARAMGNEYEMIRNFLLWYNAGSATIIAEE